MFDEAGESLPRPTALEWTALNPEIVAVDRNGVVTAVAEGQGSVQVSAADRGTAGLSVVVTALPAAGPTGIRFDPPMLSITAGETRNFAYTVYGASGEALPGVSVDLEASPAGSVTISENSITGRETGVAFVRVPGAGEESVAGQMGVAVVAAGGGSAACDRSRYKVVWCDIANPPAVMNQPGVSMTLRVDVGREPPPDCAPPRRAWPQQQSPDAIVFSIAGVADIAADGKLTALSPGVVTMRAFVEGVECDRPAKFGVGQNVGGAWSFECANGDRGELSLPASRDILMLACGGHGFQAGGCHNGSALQLLEGTSCVEPCADCAKGSCSGVGTSYSGGGMDYPDESRLCSEKTPCPNAVFVDCAGTDRGPADILGPDRRRQRECLYLRSSGPGGSCGGHHGGTYCTEGRCFHPEDGTYERCFESNSDGDLVSCWATHDGITEACDCDGFNYTCAQKGFELCSR